MVDDEGVDDLQDSGHADGGLPSGDSHPKTAPILRNLPTDKFQPPDSRVDDVRANAEAVAIESGEDLEKQAKLREHNRHQFFHDGLNLGISGVLWSVLLSLLSGVVVYTWHLLTPADLHWLSDVQLDGIKTLLGTALFSSALTGYVQKRMS